MFRYPVFSRNELQAATIFKGWLVIDHIEKYMKYGDKALDLSQDIVICTAFVVAKGCKIKFINENDS